MFLAKSTWKSCEKSFNARYVTQLYGKITCGKVSDFCAGRSAPSARTIRHDMALSLSVCDNMPSGSVITHRHYSQSVFNQKVLKKLHDGNSSHVSMHTFFNFRTLQNFDAHELCTSHLINEPSNSVGSSRLRSHFEPLCWPITGVVTMPHRHYSRKTSCWSITGQVTTRHYSSNTDLGTRSAGIQKQVSVLTAKRPTRKKMAKDKKETDTLNVTAYATAEEYNLESLGSALNGSYAVCCLPMDVEDAIFLRARNAKEGVPSEIFFFREGSAVFWNTSEMERNEVLKFLKDHSEDAYDLASIMDELEQMAVTMTRQNTNLIGDTIHLKEMDEESGQSTLEKYTFSNAMSHSVKLAMWETTLDIFVDSIEPVTDDLKDGRRVKMSRTQVLRKLGEIFALRHLINLSSDLLDTPDFYWEREHLEHLYQKTCSQLSISRRIRVMNERLDYCCSIMELLKEHLGDIHHTRLEWMIILLITFEVIFEIQKMIFH